MTDTDEAPIRRSLKERKVILASVPWVTELKKPAQCTGKGGNCKIKAHWRFRALKKSWASDGTYCWHHLIYRGLYNDMDEEERFKKWLTKMGYFNRQQTQPTSQDTAH